jgi:hypothetical protein
VLHRDYRHSDLATWTASSHSALGYSYSRIMCSLNTVYVREILIRTEHMRRIRYMVCHADGLEVVSSCATTPSSTHSLQR